MYYVTSVELMLLFLSHVALYKFVVRLANWLTD